METRADSSRVPYVLSAIVVVLAVVASATGMLCPAVYRFKNWLSVVFSNDLVTLGLAVPILVASMIRAARGSARGYAIWAGSLYYMIYNYAFYLVGAPVNKLFPAYSGLFSLSVFALVFVLRSSIVEQIGERLRARTPARPIAAYMFSSGALVGGFWLFQWLKFCVTGEVPQVSGKEDDYRMIAGIDLTFLLPLVLPAAYWLWRRRPWGYVLAVMTNVQGALYGLVLTAVSFFSWKAGTPGALTMLPVWIVFGTGSLLCLAGLLARVEAPSAVSRPTCAPAAV